MHLRRCLITSFVTAAFVLPAAAGSASAPPTGDSSGATGPETRVVTDALGVEVEIPTGPLRIVVADDIALGNLLALGVTPIATGVNTNSIPDFLGDQLDGIEDISTADSLGINIERLAALDPDLVLTVGVDWNEDNCNRLREIATTFCYAYGYTTMEEIETNMTEVGRALGMETEAAAEVAELEHRLVEMADRVESNGLTDSPVSVLRVTGDGYSVRFGTVESALMRALGMARPENQQHYQDFAFDLSPENLLDIDAYGIFVYVDTDGADTYAQLEANPLWSQLEAVQNDRVWLVDGGVWNGISLPAAHAILDDIDETFITGS